MRVETHARWLGRKTLFAAMLVGASMGVTSVSVFGQTFPNKHINVYVGYGAGATTDLSARALAEGLEKALGVPIVVENKPGATAGVAANLVAKAKPDGYTIGVVSTGVVTVRSTSNGAKPAALVSTATCTLETSGIASSGKVAAAQPPAANSAASRPNTSQRFSMDFRTQRSSI